MEGDDQEELIFNVSQAQTGRADHFATAKCDRGSWQRLEVSSPNGPASPFLPKVELALGVPLIMFQAQTGRAPHFVILAISDPTVKIYCSKPRWEPAPICRENMEQNLPREIEKLQPQTGHPPHFA